MSVPFTGSPEEAYASKPNLQYPGTQAQATAAEARAQTNLNARLASSGIDGLAITVSAGAVEVET